MIFLPKTCLKKTDSRNTQVSMFLQRNRRVAINFAGMLLVACKQHMLLLTIQF